MFTRAYHQMAMGEIIRVRGRIVEIEAIRVRGMNAAAKRSSRLYDAGG
jgi:hypothetical protein